jgi:hypothetical protein
MLIPESHSVATRCITPRTASISWGVHNRNLLGFDAADPILIHPLRIVDGSAVAPAMEAIGLEWREDVADVSSSDLPWSSRVAVLMVVG